MRISVGSDHRGFPLKQQIIPLLVTKGHVVDDEGTFSEESVDYPDFAARVAGKVSGKLADRGILICGTGIGMAIVANKFPGVRAAPCYDQLTAEISRRHNDVNVLCLPGDILNNRLVERLVETWVSTDFEGGRHARRVGKIIELERASLECRDKPNDAPLPE